MSTTLVLFARSPTLGMTLNPVRWLRCDMAHVVDQPDPRGLRGNSERAECRRVDRVRGSCT